MNSQTFVIPPELSKIIDKYIKDNKLKNGDLLFGFHSTLQLLYRLKKLLGCGVDNIRHSYINYRYSKYNLPPSKEMEEMANQLGHSLTTDLRYRKNT